MLLIPTLAFALAAAVTPPAVGAGECVRLSLRVVVGDEFRAGTVGLAAAPQIFVVGLEEEVAQLMGDGKPFASI
jgi:hypothetical protein